MSPSLLSALRFPMGRNAAAAYRRLMDAMAVAPVPCRQDPDLWFSGHPYMDVAKKMCATCEVIGPCRDYAMADQTVVGIWGGMSDRDRGKMRRKITRMRNGG